MVDDERGDDAVACASPAVGKQAERQAVGAAGDRDRKVGCALERTKRRDQGGELGVVQAWSLARRLSCSRRVRSPG
jgi:hypothetical protein